MNRRQFLKRIGAVCAAAVAVPVALVAGKEPEHGIDCNAPIKWISGQGSYIRGERSKNAITGECRWVAYYDEYSGPFSEEDLEKFRTTFKDIKSKPPVKP